MIVLAASSYTAQATLNAQLVTLNDATPIKVLYTGGKSPAEVGAALWAQSMGIPFLPMDNMLLDGAGYIYSNKGLAMMQISNTRRLLTAGTSARITAAIAAAPSRNVTVTSL